MDLSLLIYLGVALVSAVIGKFVPVPGGSSTPTPAPTPATPSAHPLLDRLSNILAPIEKLIASALTPAQTQMGVLSQQLLAKGEAAVEQFIDKIIAKLTAAATPPPAVPK